jgi:hypothetical protein
MWPDGMDPMLAFGGNAVSHVSSAHTALFGTSSLLTLFTRKGETGGGGDYVHKWIRDTQREAHSNLPVGYLNWPHNVRCSANRKT